jgi:hypothetical protein
MRVKKALENLHFWVGGLDGEIYVGVRDKNGGIGERVIVTDKVLNVTLLQSLDGKGIYKTKLPQP